MTKHRTALCLQLPEPAEGQVPQWVEVIPAANAQGLITGVDGRQWRFADPQQVALNFTRKLAVDINHSTELAAPEGRESPAVGWIEQLEVRSGALYGRISWTERGLNAVKGLEYRFLSPVLDYDDGRNVVKLVSVALTNKPNFHLALNSAQTQEPAPMKTLFALLGIAAAATEEEAIAAVNALKAQHQTALNAAKTPDLNQFVPRADFDTMKGRALNAEQKIGDADKARLQGEIDAEIGGALKDGKIAPATESYYRAMCAQDGGLAKFRDFVKVAPAIVQPGAQVPGTPPGAGTALNADQKSVMTALGLDEATFRKANGLAV